MSVYPSLMPYLVTFVVIGGLAAAVALTVLARVVRDARRTPAPGGAIRVPAARTEAAGTPAASDTRHAPA